MLSRFPLGGAKPPVFPLFRGVSVARLVNRYKSITRSVPLRSALMITYIKSLAILLVYIGYHSCVLYINLYFCVLVVFMIKPGYLSNVELIRPVGVPLSRFNAHKNWLFKTEVPLRKKTCLEKSRKSRQFNNLHERTLVMINPLFVTLTLNNDYVCKTIPQLSMAFRNWLRDKKIKHWFLVTDYGKSTNRLHFHGVIDCDVDYLKSILNFRYVGHRKGFSVYLCSDFFMGGLSFNNSYCFDSSSILYMLKYISKDSDFPHKIIGNKNSKNCMRDIALAFFGEYTVLF